MSEPIVKPEHMIQSTEEFICEGHKLEEKTAITMLVLVQIEQLKQLARIADALEGIMIAEVNKASAKRKGKVTGCHI